jgi:Fur family transcriptional regulator, ferric uptake regulator
MTFEDRALLREAYGDGRASAPRLAVARAAASIPGAFSIDALAIRVRREDPAVATATVYRAVAAMVATGFLEQVGEREGTALYARCEAGGHHHHLVCTGCGAVSHAPCPVDRRIVEHAGARGFVITGHEVSIYGLCARCVGATGSRS